MHITCERCGTVYTLDDRLIPASGAPVQCTRCGNVFTAKPPQVGQAAQPGIRHTMVQFPPEGAQSPVSRPGSPTPADEANARAGRTMMQFPAAAAKPPSGRTAPGSPADDASAASGKTMMQFSADSLRPQPGRESKPVPGSESRDPSLGRTMMQYPADAVKAPAERAPAPITPPRPQPSKTSDDAKATANRTLVQFPAVTAPPPGSKPSPKTMRFGAQPADPNPPPPANPTPRPASPFFPAGPQPPRAAGASGGRPSPRDSEAMAKTILGAPAFSAPPLPVFESQPESEPESQSDQEFEAQLKGRGRRPLLVAAALVVLAAAVGGVFAYRNRPPAIPQAAVRDREEALRLLKRDDTGSLTAAADHFAQIALQYPGYTPAITDRIVALALLEADLREQIRVLEARYTKLDRERDSIERKAETQDWRARVQEKIEAMKVIKSKADPLSEKAADLSGKLNEQLKQAMQSARAKGADDPAIARTAALHYALKGDVRAEKDAEAYRREPDPDNLLDDPRHAFADLAIALLAAYGPHNEDRIAKGRQAARDALSKDSALLRAQFALAKMALGTKDYSEAKSDLDALFIQNPKHDAGMLLREEIEAAEAADAALKALHNP